MTRIEIEYYQQELEKVCCIKLTEDQVRNFLETASKLGLQPLDAIKTLRGMSRAEISSFIGIK